MLSHREVAGLLLVCGALALPFIFEIGSAFPDVWREAQDEALPAPQHRLSAQDAPQRYDAAPGAARALDVRVMVAIGSGYPERRQAVRETWLQMQAPPGAAFRHIFLVTLPVGNDSVSTLRRESILRENATYGDLAVATTGDNCADTRSSGRWCRNMQLLNFVARNSLIAGLPFDYLLRVGSHARSLSLHTRSLASLPTRLTMTCLCAFTRCSTS
jgi:hypothetical protein